VPTVVTPNEVHTQSGHWGNQVGYPGVLIVQMRHPVCRGVLHATRAAVQAVVDVGVLPDFVVSLEARLDVAGALQHARVGGHDGILARRDIVRPVNAEKARARGHDPKGRGGHGGQGQRAEHEPRDESSGKVTTLGRHRRA
jgi:hypothetical protein